MTSRCLESWVVAAVWLGAENCSTLPLALAWLHDVRLGKNFLGWVSNAVTACIPSYSYRPLPENYKRCVCSSLCYVLSRMGFAVRVRSAGQKYGPTCHQRDRANVTEFVTLVRLSSLGQHVGVLALAEYKRRKSALTAGPIVMRYVACTHSINVYTGHNLSAMSRICGLATGESTAGTSRKPHHLAAGSNF